MNVSTTFQVRAPAPLVRAALDAMWNNSLPGAPYRVLAGPLAWDRSGGTARFEAIGDDTWARGTMTLTSHGSITAIRFQGDYSAGFVVGAEAGASALPTSFLDGARAAAERATVDLQGRFRPERTGLL